MPRLADLLRQMELQKQETAPVPSPLPPPAEMEVPVAAVEVGKEERVHHIDLELTSEQLQKLIDAVVPEVMSVEQLARYLQKGKGWVRQMARSGEIPATKMGNSWRFMKRKVDEWVHSQMSASMKP